MASCTHVFQISGIKIRDKKRVLVQGIQQLGGKYIGGSVSRDPSKYILGKVAGDEAYDSFLLMYLIIIQSERFKAEPTVVPLNWLPVSKTT